nr:FlgD immunoglobulin-like domain containing protein [Candidatus Krumholzibacteria bacterium]
MFRSHFPFWSPGLLSLCLLLLLSASPAWSTEWVEHDVAGLGSGTSYLYAWGGDGIGVTQPTAQAILFFNARTGVWTWHDLDAAMSVVSVRAEGFMVLCVGTDSAVVYNTQTDTVAELVYNGTLLSTSGNSRSFDCGRELALVVTDQEFCVFDAETDQWSRLPYSLFGTPAFTQRHQVHDTYAVSFLPLTNNTVVNLVYSLDQHAFNQTDMGLHALASPMDHGYAGFRNQYEADDYLLGYSALTNSFSYLPFTDGSNWTSATVTTDEALGPRTAFAACYEEDYPEDIRHYHLYGFDTRYGYWVHRLEIVNDTEYTIGSGWWEGGAFMATSYFTHDPDQENLLVWDGTSNSFYFQATGLAHYIGVVPGGNVLLAKHEGDYLGLTVDDQIHGSLTVDPLTYDRASPGLNYVDFLSEGPGDLVTVNVYQGAAGGWLQHATGPHTAEGFSAPHVHLRLGDDPQREAVFYSAYRQEIYGYGLGGWPPVSGSVTDHYSFVTTADDDRGILFDAHRGTVYEWNDMEHKLAGGERIFCLIDNDAGEAQAYSLTTGSWSTQALSAESVPYAAKDRVALVQHATEHVYYACYAEDGSWAKLEPYGIYKGRGVGDRTAFYLTGDKAYGLGTGAVTPVQMSHMDLLPGHGAVAIQFESNLDYPEGALVLNVTGPAPETDSWQVPLVREGSGRFRALDSAPQLALGGEFTYSLEQADPQTGSSVLESQTILLLALPAARLDRIHPNPANPRTQVEFSLARRQQVSLKVYDLAGRLVRTLVDESRDVGKHVTNWDGCDERGGAMASGVYVVRLDAEAGSSSRKVMLVR